MTLPDGRPAAAVVRVPFHGTEIHTVLIDGEPQVVLRPTIGNLGLDYSAQLKKLDGKSWATVADTATVAEDGKVREMKTVDLDTWAMLLANIDEKRVSASVKPLVVFYQKESAKALRQFWTKGGAIADHATDEQLAVLADELERRRLARAESRIRVLVCMGDAVDPQWRENNIRHEWSVARGVVADIAHENRLLMTEPYLEERGVSKADIQSIRSVFGKRVKAAYMLAYGREPQETTGLVNGRERPVKGYYERDRRLFDEVFERYYSHLAGPAQLELGGAA